MFGASLVSYERSQTVNMILLIPYPHITPRRVLDRFQCTLARHPRRHFGRALAGEPDQPVRPPRAWIFLGLGEPAVEVGVARPLAGPILVFVLGRRIDHPGDMAGAGHHEAPRAAEEFAAEQHRFWRRDMVFAGRQIVD